PLLGRGVGVPSGAYGTALAAATRRHAASPVAPMLPGMGAACVLAWLAFRSPGSAPHPPDGTLMTIAPERARIYEGSRIPHPIPSVLLVPDELRETGDVLQVNFGPNHPSTHGVLRLIVDLNGEDVVGLAAVVGYL